MASKNDEPDFIASTLLNPNKSVCADGISISIDQLENSAISFQDQVKHIKETVGKEVHRLKSQLSKRDNEIKEERKKVLELSKSLQNVSNELQNLKTQHQPFEQTILELENQMEEQKNLIAILTTENQQMMAHQNNFVDGLKKISCFSGTLQIDENNDITEQTDDTEDLLHHVASRFETSKKEREELERLKKLVSDIGKQFQASISANIYGNRSRQRNIQNDSEVEPVPETKFDVSGGISNVRLPVDTNSSVVNAYEEPSSSNTNSVQHSFPGNQSDSVNVSLSKPRKRKQRLDSIVGIKRPIFKISTKRVGTGANGKGSKRSRIVDHKKNLKFECELCSYRFQYLSYLKKHMAATHKIPDYLQNFARGCQLCGQVLETNQKYWEHRATFHNLKRKSTNKNPKRSNQKTGAAIPRKDPVFISKRPSALSSTDTEILDRYLTEQAESSGECHAPVENPQKAGFNEENLQQQQQHECQCGKVYLSRTALLQHIKSIKYGMIFKCLLCTRGFSQLVNLQAHTRSVHHEECNEFACGTCNELFTTRKEFTSHCQSEHDQKNK